MNPIRGCDTDSRLSAPTLPAAQAPPKATRRRRPTRSPDRFRLSRRQSQLIETLVTVGWTITPLAAATLVLALDTIV
jgi:hypothetical protein